MTEPLIFRILVGCVLVGFIAHRAYYTRKYPPENTETVEVLKKSPATYLSAATFLLALVSTFIYIFFPGWISWAAIPLPTWCRWLGIVLVIAGFILLEWSHRTLGRNWSDQPRITQTQQLVQGGPYKYIRHPIYTSFLLILGSSLLISANWLVGGLWIVAVGLETRNRIRYEEASMVARFGEAYREYKEHTGALLPWL